MTAITIPSKPQHTLKLKKMTQLLSNIGIDVGGVKKGFHAVANIGGQYLDKLHSIDPEEIVAWALSHHPSAIAIDAPCMFSLNSGSRKAERDLVSAGMRCFYTPTRALAAKSRFYDWVFNAERLYEKLGLPLFMGESFMDKLFMDKPCKAPCVIETFPHAVQIALCRNDAAFIPEASKSCLRRQTLLQKAAYDVSHLNNIDFIDAALCAVSADYFAKQQFTAYGCTAEGFIVIPNSASASYSTT
jgi:predicted nuclease with RNAse H fold